MQTYISGTEVDVADDRNCISFRDGRLFASTYSYHMDSEGDMQLNREITRKVYEVMRAYYEA